MKTQLFGMRLLFSALVLTLSACSGGGGGGGSSSNASTPTYVKAAKVKCGSNDCITGAAISGLSLKASGIQTFSTGDDMYTTFKAQYDAAKLAVANSNSVIEQLNLMADDNGITSCDEIPTTGNFTFGGWSYVLGGHYDSFDIGQGSVSTDHSLKGTNSSGDTIVISFKCGTTQSVHIITKAGSSGDLYEYFYQLNTGTSAIVLQYGSVSGSNKAYGYFRNDGGDAFTFGLFQNTTGGTSPNAVVGGAKDYTSATSTVTAASAMLSFAFTSVSHEDIDSVSALSNDTTHYRACVTANRTSVVSNSCANQANVSGSTGTEVDFSVGSVPNSIGNASAWSTDDVKSLSITDPASISL